MNSQNKFKMSKAIDSLSTTTKDGETHTLCKCSKHVHQDTPGRPGKQGFLNIKGVKSYGVFSDQSGIKLESNNDETRRKAVNV